MTSKAAVIVAALLALVALVETGAALSARSRVATDGDWDAAAAEVRAGFTDGDLIAFAPAWADPVGRGHLGDLVNVEMAGRSDADRYARVWELSIRGAHAPDAAGARLVRESRHGRVRVALYEKAAAPIAYDFTAAARDARVLRAGEPCFGDPQSGWRCGSQRVERRTLEIDYRPRRGLLVPADTRATTLGYSEVPLGDTLVVYAGLHDYYARKSADGLVDFFVDVDGVEKLRARIGNDDGWRRFTVDTRALAGSRHSVTFHVAAMNPSWRNFGFHAEARR
ncbi:MAG: hypothetical protein JWM53_2019 [bacterium]|nr:hypothetical protein [bacterium]